MSYSAYGWIIDIDHMPDLTQPVGTNSNAKGVMGPHNIDPALVERLSKGQGHVFRMKDADDELYYTGRIITAPGDEDGEFASAPLDDFGKPNAGAVSIWYLKDGHWSEL